MLSKLRIRINHSSRGGLTASRVNRTFVRTVSPASDTSFFSWKATSQYRFGSRALEILTVFLERAGELVSKQELMSRVWPNVFVEPANLTVHMSALRRTLRDGRDGNPFIINVPGRGYSFVASVAIAD
jgi:DNA-binding response OmpR family regulator